MSGRFLRRVALSAVLSIGIGSTSRAADILVSAAASLRDVMKELAGRYETATDDRVVLNLASSGTLALQITRGAPVDLFFSADETRMDLLEREGLVRVEDRVDLLSNRLVVVVSAEEPEAPIRPEDLRRFRRIAIGDPDSVPAGVYARQWLLSEGLWDALQDRLIPTVDVRAALAAVEGGHAGAAIVYATDAQISRRVRVALKVPTSRAPRIVYPLAVIAASAHALEARRLAAWLASPEARAVFEEYGFTVLPGREGG